MLTQLKGLQAGVCREPHHTSAKRQGKEKIEKKEIFSSFNNTRG
jgi:hypothetical protein